LNFRDFEFESSLQEGLDAMGFEKPTPIQEQAIPIILQGHDLIACAQTGTGKTAAYVLPVIHRIAQSDHSHLNTLIIAPTRELAQQIDQQIEGFSYFAQVSSIPIYGGGDGMAWEQQKRALREGADIIIATPGRLISLISGGDVDFSRLKHLILDEADRMLDMGFYDDIVRIIRALPHERQTLLFSATMPPKIRNMAREFLNNPKEVTIAVSRPADKIHQVVHFIHDEQKIPMAVELLKDPVHQSVIVFASTKEAVKKLNLSLRKAGLRTAAFHSDLEQAQREELMRDFKARNLRVLVGTDVLSRGIDVEGIGMVLNFDVPPDPEDYIHRIGRTARADETGLAVTFVNHRDLPRFRRIEQLIGHPLDVSPIPAHLGAAPDFSAETVREKRSGSKNKRPFYRKKKGGTAGNAGS
jgi:superfamily II DNA/RNA helicase